MGNMENKNTKHHIINKKELEEFVDSDGGMIGGDRNVTSNSEIETGPVQKPWNDNSDYEKGMSTTTDRAIRYRQNIPWFAVYSYRSSSGRGLPINETNPQKVEDKIKEDLVKKSKKDNEIFDKEYDNKTEKVLDVINDIDLSDKQLERIKKAVLDKINKKNG
jgi:hypothetical protein